MKLFHIGLHKCGSTSLQKALADQDLMPFFDGSPWCDIFHHMEGARWAISSEGFSGAPWAPFKKGKGAFLTSFASQINALASLVPADIFLMVVRPPSQFFASLYVQHIKEGGSHPVAAFDPNHPSSPYGVCDFDVARRIEIAHSRIGNARLRVVPLQSMDAWTKNQLSLVLEHSNEALSPGGLRLLRGVNKYFVRSWPVYGNRLHGLVRRRIEKTSRDRSKVILPVPECIRSLDTSYERALGAFTSVWTTGSAIAM